MRAPEMRAVAAAPDRTDAGALSVINLPRPEAGPGQILIRVRAAGVNRPDVLQRMGLYPPPAGASEILGLEVAGEVAALGPGAARWRVGDRVAALLSGGGYAEYAVADARHALPVPAGVSFAEAAGLPETTFTVWANVFERAGLAAGETLVVHGATSGIGVAAIQTAKAAGARVIATSRTAAKAAEALRLGADVAIDASAEDWSARVSREGGADVILDMVAGEFVPKGLDCLNTDGRLVLIAFQAGPRAEIDLSKIMLKRLTLTGSTLRSRSADEKARLAAAVERTVWPWIEAGRVKPVLDQVFPLERAADAHRRLESGAHTGKIVLEVATD